MEITFPQKPIPQAEFVALRNYFIKSADYSVIDEDGPLILEGKKLAPSLTTRQIFAIRSSVMKNKIINRFGYLARISEKAARGYSDGKSIIELSTAFDFSPIHLFRAIMESEGKNLDNLAGRDAEQYDLAVKNDMAASDKEHETAKRAEDAERRFVEHVRSFGVEMKTQEQLVQEQIKSAGRAKLTPDILFTRPILVNGEYANWLEFKNYVGAPIGFISKSNAKQAKKYYKAYGPGAICYSGSFVSGHKIKHARLLDVSSIFSQ